MNKTTKVDREKWIAYAAQHLRYNWSDKPWMPSNRTEIVVGLMKQYKISLESAKTAVFHANTRRTSKKVKSGIWG